MIVRGAAPLPPKLFEDPAAMTVPLLSVNPARMAPVPVLPMYRIPVPSLMSAVPPAVEKPWALKSRIPFP